MGKKQHQKDRNFLTAKEWKEEWGGAEHGQSVMSQYNHPLSLLSTTFNIRTPF